MQMNIVKNRIRHLKDGQVLKVYFEKMKEITDVKEGAGVDARGAETGHMAQSGKDSEERR